MVRRWPSVEKAQRLLGWEAQIDVRAGIRQTVDWLRGHVEAARAAVAPGYLTLIVFLTTALLPAASVPVTVTTTFALPFTSDLRIALSAFLLSLSLIVTVLPVPTRLEPLATRTSFFALAHVGLDRQLGRLAGAHLEDELLGLQRLLELLGRDPRASARSCRPRRSSPARRRRCSAPPRPGCRATCLHRGWTARGSRSGCPCGCCRRPREPGTSSTRRLRRTSASRACRPSLRSRR